MFCAICELDKRPDELLLTIDKSELVCDECTNNIAVEMTIVRGEFRKSDIQPIGWESNAR